MNNNYDFSGWATRANTRCSDGRTILPNAFKDNDGKTVPIVWNHQHGEASNVLGHALLENRPEGVYAYGYFNETDDAKTAKELVRHGDIRALSIYANQLKEQNTGRGRDVYHGMIRELSLVLAGANPGAFIDSVIQHSDGSFSETDEEVILSFGDPLSLRHSDDTEEKKAERETEEDSDETVQDVFDTMTDEQKNVVYFLVDKAVNGETAKHSDDEDEPGEGSGKTVKEIFDSMSEKQKTAAYAIIGAAMENADNEDDESDEDDGGEAMHSNIWDTENEQENVLTHADQEAILNIAKSNSCGSLRAAMDTYMENEPALAHGFDSIETLFPEYKDVPGGMPAELERDQSWVESTIGGAHKSPISRIRTRQFDLRADDLRGKGYQKGTKKTNGGNIKLLKRTTDPQTVYRKDQLNRDDIIDITDFDVVEYQYKVMRKNLNEEIAKAILVGDGREEGDADKIEETHIRSIWNDDELYTIHTDVDIAAAKAELQGTDTGAHFGDNYVYAEAIITAALYAREKYKGSGNLTFYCTPHLLNVMLLARDLNGRRIYASKAELTAALNVSKIETVEQFEGLVRKDTDQKQHKLLGIFVNMSDYTIGATKGGEITRFNQFDIDFNQEKYLIETRISGALTKAYSAIALEEPVA